MPRNTAVSRSADVAGEIRPVRPVLDVFRRVFRAEFFVSVAFLAGWALLTAGIAALTSPLAWLFSGGLLGVALGGIRLFAVVAWYGLYDLSRRSDG